MAEDTLTLRSKQPHAPFRHRRLRPRERRLKPAARSE